MHGSKSKLQINLAPDLWLVEVDKGQINQVISNLVINAQEAMPTGGTINLMAENLQTLAGCYVKITIADEGVGIAPQYLDKIFDPYFTTKQKGGGLGLTTSYSIITKHKGQIRVDSRLNQGTTFTILLPAVEKPAGTSVATWSQQADAPGVASAWILIMDDEEAVRNVNRAMLQRLGYRVSFAVEGQEAIAKYKEAMASGMPYQAVFLDLTIPGGMGGQDAAREILGFDPQATLIVSSGYANDPVMASYREYGFKARVVKPYNFTDLQNAMRQVLG